MSSPKAFYKQIKKCIKMDDPVEAATLFAAWTKAYNRPFYEQLCKCTCIDTKPKTRKRKTPEIQHRCHATVWENGTGDGCCKFAAKEFVDLPDGSGSVGLCTTHANLWKTCCRPGKPSQQHQFYRWKFGAPKPEPLETWKDKHIESLTLNLKKLKKGERNEVPYTYGIVYVVYNKIDANYSIDISFPRKNTKCEKTFVIPKPKNGKTTIKFNIPQGLKYGLKYGPDHKPYPKVIFKGPASKHKENGYSEDKFRRSCIENITHSSTSPEEDNPPLPPANNSTASEPSDEETIESFNEETEPSSTNKTKPSPTNKTEPSPTNKTVIPPTNDSNADDVDDESDDDESEDESEDESDESEDESDESDDDNSVDSQRLIIDESDSDSEDSD